MYQSIIYESYMLGRLKFVYVNLMLSLEKYNELHVFNELVGGMAPVS